jgi:hypothetical protein
MTPTHIQVCLCYSHRIIYVRILLSSLFLVSSVVSENIVPQMRIQNMKEIYCIFRHTRATSITVLKHTANWLTLTWIFWVFASNFDRKRSNLTECAWYFALYSFSKCYGNRINQATTTSSHILDAYPSLVKLMIEFVCNIRCRDYYKMKIKKNPDFNKYFLSYHTYCRITRL